MTPSAMVKELSSLADDMHVEAILARIDHYDFRADRHDRMAEKIRAIAARLDALAAGLQGG